MFKIISNNVEFYYQDYERAKSGEAVFRALRESYTFYYPDGAILECKFNLSVKNPNKQKIGLEA